MACAAFGLVRGVSNRAEVDALKSRFHGAAGLSGMEINSLTLPVSTGH